MTSEIAEPAREVFAQDFRDGRQKIRVGLEVQGPRLRLFARTKTRRGRKWVDDGGVDFSPDLPPLVQAPLAAAFGLFLDKRAQVEQVLKDGPKRSRRGRRRRA